MKQLITEIIENKGDNYFEFNRNFNNPIKHLKEQTTLVPERPGLYLVFSKKNDDVLTKNCSHINFEIEKELYELIYFGKAGGLTKKGRIIRQGLNGRINNVVSDSFRKLKDIKRAIYWNIIMNEYNFQTLTVIYFLHDNPQEVENIIYEFLDGKNLKYPLMNKRRGR